MAKFCQNCGKELTGNESVCSDCGSNVKSTSSSNNSGAPIVQKREIVVSIILSFVTCGLYGLYWIICMNNDANKVSGENTPTGGVVILLTLVTCGIYFIYWNYKMGKKMEIAGKTHNKDIADNSILYLLLAIFGLSIVNYCLIQTDLNKFAD